MVNAGFLTEGGGLLKILYLGVRNSIEGLADAAFTQANNTGSAQKLANTTLTDVKKLGCLAGSVAAVVGEGVLGAGTESNTIVGLFVNDLAGNAYESSSAAASEKGVYVCGMGTYEVGIFETADTAGASIMGDYSYGKPLYCSVNGLLTVAEGLTGAPGTVMGYITKAPTAADPTMRFNLRM